MDAFVHSVVDALVGFAYPLIYYCRVSFNDLKRTIFAAAVDDDEFKIFVKLTLDILNGSLQIVSPIVDDGND